MGARRRAVVGALLWVSSVQYFVVQLIAALDWPFHYSWRFNAISDLGNTKCADFANRHVCSPLHTWMNLSFVLLGLAQAGGALLIRRRYPGGGTAPSLGFGAMIAAGFGTVIVGLSPENVSPGPHALGAFLPFIGGNLGMLALAREARLPAGIRWFSLLCGGVGAVALLFLGKQGPLGRKGYPGIGFGGIERLVAYPQTIWLILVGAWLLVDLGRRGGRHRSSVRAA